MKHTPAPWKAHSKNSSIIASEDYNLICECYSDGSFTPPLGSTLPSEPEKKANAKLIAAAPDMLSACMMAKQELVLGGDWDTAIKIIDKAIKKATS